MEPLDYSRFFLSLAFVIGLIWGAAYLLKKFGIDKKLRGASGQAGRLQIVDVLYLDPRRKLLITRADTREYLLLVHGDAVTVIDKFEKETV
jgi:flagellar protein FliO/FliZ